MLIDKIEAKNNANEINVIIEIPMNSGPVKYEFDKESGAIFVDRFMQTTMSYPCNYGFIPHTLSDDGDPIDVLVISGYAVVPGSVVKCRAVGVLMMEDESGCDEKIIAVPAAKLDPSFEHIRNLEDIPDILRQRIRNFFEHYKDLDKGKWVKVSGWEDKAKADELIDKGIIKAKNK